MPKTKLAKVSLTPKGAWDSTTAYEQLDLVSYDGGSWVAKKPSTGVTPRENDCWMQAAKKGATGEKGAAGDTTETAKASYVSPRNTTATLDFSTLASCPFTKGDVFAFIPADHIVIEETIDGGETWTVTTKYTDIQKRTIFNSVQGGVLIGIPMIDGKQNALCGMRITITAANFTVPSGTTDVDRMSYWTKANKTGAERYASYSGMYIWGRYSGGSAIEFSDETGSLSDSGITWAKLNSGVQISGWNGPNFIYKYIYSGQQLGGWSSSTANLFHRFTFFTGNTTENQTSQKGIYSIAAVPHSIYNSGSAGNYMATNHIYSFDIDKNCTFPAKLYSEGGYVVPDKQYELIEDITTTEAVTIIERSTEPDGTAYNFRKVFVVGTVWLDSSETSGGRIGIDQVNGLSFLAQLTSNPIVTALSDWVGWVELEIKNGVLRSTIGRNHESYDTTLRESNHAISNKALAIGKYGDTIKKIRIRHYNMRLLAAGVNVKIYGIRA